MTMNTTRPAPAGYSDEPYVAIPVVPVTSNQVAAIGYDAPTKTLAVTFTRGVGAIYHYPNVEAELHAAFVSAESIGKFFGMHIKALPFKKFAPPAAADPSAVPGPHWGNDGEPLPGNPVLDTDASQTPATEPKGNGETCQ